jgi:ATP-dependent protease HslVU (ClpYQ) peptidase subunit
MTTIAFKNGIMAADGQESSGHMITRSDVVKIVKQGGLYIGLAGSGDCFEPVLDFFKVHPTNYLKANPTLKAVLDSVSEVLVYDTKAKKLLCFTEEGYSTIGGKDCSYTIGSGHYWAQSAFHFGSDAKEAVLHACKFDIYSGGLITVLGGK